MRPIKSALLRLWIVASAIWAVVFLWAKSQAPDLPVWGAWAIPLAVGCLLMAGVWIASPFDKGRS